MKQPTVPAGQKRRVRRRSEKRGLPPGSLVAVGKTPASPHSKISLISYDASAIEERELTDINDIMPHRDTPQMSWINIEGMGDLDLIARVGEHFGLHPLVVEDMVNADIRPKEEDHGEYIVIILRMMYPVKKIDGSIAEQFHSEQVSIVFAKSWILTFQDGTDGDVFSRVRDRLRSAKGNLRDCGVDALAYALVDAIVDGYFAVLEEIGETVEAMEVLISDQNPDFSMTKIHDLRRFALAFRRAVWPVRDILASIDRDSSPLIQRQTHLFFRDIYDHTVEIMDMTEAYREMISSLMELQLSSVSNRMNSIMMVLTVVTTIFMPLSFIAGVYGMNFEFMPELHWRYGYPAALLLMFTISVGMLVYFRRRRFI